MAELRAPTTMSEPADVERFEEILHYLHHSRGIDFTAYKRSSLTRRVNRRMQASGFSSYQSYFDHLQVHQEESTALLNTIFINVTSFFRDEDVWTYLQETALPVLLARRTAAAPFRVWTAGCASGEEAYTVSMVLAEVIGSEAIREHVEVHATDADEAALADARLATYASAQVEGVPAPLLEKYFERNGTSYTVNRDLRRLVVFSRHDLLHDAPISGVDLLLCRNTLMYFTAEAQARTLERFSSALNPGGQILLGRPELLFGHANLFTPVDLKRRLFKRMPRPADQMSESL